LDILLTEEILTEEILLSGSDCELKIHKACRLEPEKPISKYSQLGLPRYIRTSLPLKNDGKGKHETLSDLEMGSQFSHWT